MDSFSSLWPEIPSRHVLTPQWTWLTRYYRTQSPEIQTMYSLDMPVSAIRTKIRQEFEKHRYVGQLNVVDVLIYQSHAEFQVSPDLSSYNPISHAGFIKK